MPKSMGGKNLVKKFVCNAFVFAMKDGWMNRQTLANWPDFSKRTDVTENVTFLCLFSFLLLFHNEKQLRSVVSVNSLH